VPGSPLYTLPLTGSVGVAIRLGPVAGGNRAAYGYEYVSI